MQLLGRKFGSERDPSVVVDWAYGDYRWRDQLGLRAGRIKLPYGLYNQERDVDMLRTSVLDQSKSLSKEIADKSDGVLAELRRELEELGERGLRRNRAQLITRLHHLMSFLFPKIEV